MKYFYFLLFLISHTVTFGQQNKEIFIPENKIDNIYFRWVKEEIEHYGLKNLLESRDSLNVRIWLSNMIFDFRISSNGEHYANLTTMIRFSPDDKRFKNDPIWETRAIEISKAEVIISTAIENDILTLPDDSEIKGYITNVDGINYLFEISDREKYYFYSYWSPSMQNNEIPQVKKVRKILEIIETELELQKVKKEFLSRLKPGSYDWGMTRIKID